MAYIKHYAKSNCFELPSILGSGKIEDEELELVRKVLSRYLELKEKREVNLGSKTAILCSNQEDIRSDANCDGEKWRDEGARLLRKLYNEDFKVPKDRNEKINEILSFVIGSPILVPLYAAAFPFFIYGCYSDYSMDLRFNNKSDLKKRGFFSFMMDNLTRESTELIRNATSKNLEKVIRDRKYKNIVLIGHSTYHSWVASDKEVDWYDLSEMVGDHLKNGVFVNSGCGEIYSWNRIPLGYFVVNDPENLYGKKAEFSWNFLSRLEKLRGPKLENLIKKL